MAFIFITPKTKLINIQKKQKKKNSFLNKSRRWDSRLRKLHSSKSLEMPAMMRCYYSVNKTSKICRRWEIVQLVCFRQTCLIMKTIFLTLILCKLSKLNYFWWYIVFRVLITIFNLHIYFYKTYRGILLTVELRVWHLMSEYAIIVIVKDKKMYWIIIISQ